MLSRCPHFFTIRDGMQGMELALRTPLTEAARNALVSSWRRLLLRVRTLRLAARGLMDAVRRQDQVLVVDEGRYEMLSRCRRVTQFPQHESNTSHWEVGLQKFPSHVARENELIYSSSMQMVSVSLNFTSLVIAGSCCRIAVSTSVENLWKIYFPSTFYIEGKQSGAGY
jgi:hypothetical protein